MADSRECIRESPISCYLYQARATNGMRSEMGRKKFYGERFLFGKLATALFDHLCDLASFRLIFFRALSRQVIGDLLVVSFA